MFWVYVLKSTCEGKLYTGSTSDLNKRLEAHNSGKVRSTKARKPWSVVCSEQYASVTEARKRENFLKSGHGRRWLKNVIFKTV